MTLKQVIPNVGLKGRTKDTCTIYDNATCHEKCFLSVPLSFTSLFYTSSVPRDLYIYVEI